MTVGVGLTVNSKAVSYEVEEDETLLDLLRDRMGLLSAKDGCQPEGYCGCCTVLVDGRARVSCSQPATSFAGKEIVTLEGLDDETREAFALGFASTGASQCGFCSPGIVMKASHLLHDHPQPSRDEISRALAGNLCRCTGYVKIVDAVERAAAMLRGEERPVLDWSGRIGTRAPKFEAFEMAQGAKPFIDDLEMDGLLHAALRFSDHPCAVVMSIDVSQARAMQGVRAVILAEDVPGEREIGLIYNDWPAVVAEGETTRYVGDVLAIVVADHKRTARKAAAAIEVQYKVLDPVTDMEEALEPGAHQVHAKGNLLKRHVIDRGDAEAAIASSAHVVTETFETQFIEHAFLEPESAIAWPDEGEMRVLSGGQGIWDDRKQIARLLGLTEKEVRVSLVSNGGGFGGKRI